MSTSRVFVGKDFFGVGNLSRTLTDAREHFDFIVIPLVHPRFRRNVEYGVQRDLPFTRSDMLFNSQSWNQHIVAKTSTWLEFDSSHELTNHNSEQVFIQEVGYASHLGVHALFLNQPLYECTNYARCIYQAITTSTFLPFWIHVQVAAVNNIPSVNDDGVDINDPWEAWNRLRLLCQSDPRLFVALELSEELPSPIILQRWLGEPIKVVLLPTHIFITDKFGRPGLSNAHRAFLFSLFSHQVSFMNNTLT